MLNVPNRDSQWESDLEIKLLALEMNELENHKNNMRVLATLKDVREENKANFEQFKKEMGVKVKNAFVNNPFASLFAVTGIAATRSLFFGGAVGIAGFCAANRLYGYFSTKNFNR